MIETPFKQIPAKEKKVPPAFTSEPAIRRARPPDMPKIIRLWKALMHHHRRFGHGRGIFEYRKDAPALYGKFLARQLRRRNAAVFVAEAGGRIVGHVMVESKKVPPVYVHSSEAYVDEIMVEKRWRRRGIGKSLLAKAAAWARGKKLYSIALNVHARNAEATAAYEKSGFAGHHIKMAKVL